MAKWISGRDALEQLDRRLGRLRHRLNDAIQAADSIEGRLAEIQSHRVGAMQRLADMRLDLIQQADVEDLDRLHRQALELLQTHTDYIEEERETLESASESITDLETQRADLTDQRLALETQIETKLAEIEARLKDDAAYRDLVQAFEDADAIADRADQKLAVAIDEREEKSDAYLSDPLFSYLWRRGFGTTTYKGGGLFKMLDGWVAKLCKYDGARPNFARLNDITDWLGDHAEATREAAQLAKTTLETAEGEAIAAAGVPDDEKSLEDLQDKISAVDERIVSAETRHSVLAEQHAKTLSGEEGPAKQARRLLERGLQNMSIPDLRKLAAETVTLDDDEIVDDLVELRTEEMSLELETERVSDAPTRLGEELGAFESLRRRFKEARFDSDAALIKIALFDDALESLASGRSSVSRALKQIHQSVKRKDRRTRNGFGGRASNSDFEIYDVIGVIAEEALRLGMGGMGSRRRGKFPTRGRGTSRRSSPRRRGGGGGGGFKTGGGF
ncbi:MAG: hypothetical protein HRT81_01485 [Henriciella sp.]|nr:hypothetical protein [Henriciella sp.]